MDLKEIQDWTTLIGAVVAAVAAIWNLLLQMRGKKDNFRVGLDTVMPSCDPLTMMHVISFSDHPIKLADWGFIDANGRFESIPMTVQVSFGEDLQIVGHGEATLASRGDAFERGYERQVRPVGAFARSIMQRRPRLHFRSDTPYMLRLRIRLRLLLRPNYFLWPVRADPPPTALGATPPPPAL
jgi:hypothetical protein